MQTKDIVAEEIKKRTLDIIVSKKDLELGEFVIENLGVDVMHGLYDNRILYTMHTLIPAENVKEETHTLKVKHPSDWKQAFKEAHFPEWLKKRYPVVYLETTETIRFVAYNIYPKFPAISPYKCRDAVQYITKSIDDREEELAI